MFAPPLPPIKRAVMSVVHRCNLRVVQAFCGYLEPFVFLGTYPCFLILFLTIQSGTALQAGKVAVSIPDGVIGNFTDIILPSALCPWGCLSL
jgi:hypothetical protein